MVKIPEGFKLIHERTLLYFEYITTNENKCQACEYITTNENKCQACEYCPVRFECYTSNDLRCIIPHIWLDYSELKVVWGFPNEALIKSHYIGDCKKVDVSSYFTPDNLRMGINKIGQILLDIYLENGLEWIHRNKANT